MRHWSRPCGGRQPVTGAATVLPIRAQKKAIDDHGGSRFSGTTRNVTLAPSKMLPAHDLACAPFRLTCRSEGPVRSEGEDAAGLQLQADIVQNDIDPCRSEEH